MPILDPHEFEGMALRQEIATLKAKLTRLRAVAEAAERYVDDPTGKGMDALLEVLYHLKTQP